MQPVYLAEAVRVTVEGGIFLVVLSTDPKIKLAIKPDVFLRCIRESKRAYRDFEKSVAKPVRLKKRKKQRAHDASL
jgi:hypothetical protein